MYIVLRSNIQSDPLSALLSGVSVHLRITIQDIDAPGHVVTYFLEPHNQPTAGRG